MKILITENQYKKLVKHKYQPDGISCGPTCIKMVGEFFKGNIDEIDEICKHCETDNIIGTPPERMKKGLNKLKIDYIEHINDSDPFQTLRDVIDNGSIAILRTFTQKVPHWIVVHSYKENEPEIFNVNDPWLGPLTYNEDELDEIWKERNHYFFEIVQNNEQDIDEHNYDGIVSFRNYNPNTDAEFIYKNLGVIFKKTGLSNGQIWGMVQPIDPYLSIVAEVDGNIAGFYILKESTIPPTDTDLFRKLKNLKGVEGVALGIIEEYKNYGIGKDLIEHPKTLGFDYIWGYQLKSLENINDWLKRRKIYAETRDLYVTYQVYQ
jgi:hypothetical protein